LEIRNPNRVRELEYSTIEFELINATPNAQNVDLFDSNNLVDVPFANGVGAFPNVLGQQITVGTTYNGLAFDSLRKNIVTGDSSGNIRIINASTGNILFSTTSSTPSARMIYVPQKDLIYSVGGGIISVINPVNGIEITSVNFGAGLSFNDLVYCPVNGRIYIKDASADQKLWFFDTGNNTNAGFYQPPLGGFTANITYVSSNNSVYIFDQTFTNIYQFSCATNTLAATIGGAGTAVIGVYSSSNNEIFYQDSGAGVLKVVNVSTNTITGTTIAGFAGVVTDMTYSPDTNHIWVLNDGADAINVVSASADAIITTLGMPVDWSGNVVYATGINTVYSTSSTAINYVQQIDATGNQFYIDGSSDYNQFVRDNLISPKKLDRIMIYAEDNDNLLNAIGVNTESANGESCGETRLPNITVGANQFQGQIGQVDFEDYILDVTSSINYTIPAFTTIKWVIYYKEYKRSDLLAGRSMIESFDAYKPKDPDTYDEKYLLDTQLTPTWVENIEVKKFIEEAKRA